jgi:phosphopantothenoylcysteine decarboxylase / phosphopantothenate---cysteine ligase
MTGTTTSERGTGTIGTVEAPFPVRNVLLGLSGGVAAALAPAWIYWARSVLGVRIRVVATDTALAFATPAALSAFSGNEVATDRTPMSPQGRPSHVLLARWAEIALVAPATGNTVAKLASGIGDNLLCTTVLHCQCPVVVAPSLNDALVDARSTRRNLTRLRQDGVGVVPTVDGLSLMDGAPAPGAMPDAPTVFAFAASFFLAQHVPQHAHQRTGGRP